MFLNDRVFFPAEFSEIYWLVRKGPCDKRRSVMVQKVAGSNSSSASRRLEHTVNLAANGYLFRFRE